MTEIHSYFADEIFRIGTELKWIIVSCNQQNLFNYFAQLLAK